MTSVNQDIWKKIYPLAAEIYQLAPWNAMEEQDIFGVQSPDSWNNYFVSVMGSAGVLHGISAYEGSRALGQFWQMQADPQNADPQTVLSIPHLIITFDKQEYIEPGHIPLIKEHAPFFGENDIWPDVKQVIPGRVPALPSGDKAKDLIQVLEQTLEVCRRAKENLEFLFPEDKDEDEYFIRKPVFAGQSFTWEDEYRHIEETPVQYKFSFSPDMLEKFMQLPQKSTVLQTDLVMLPTPINDEQEGPFFPFMLLAVSKKQGTVDGFKLLQPIPDIDSMHSNVPGSFMEMMVDAGYRPNALEVRNSLVYELLGEVLPKGGINISKVSKLKMVDDAVKSFVESMQ